MELENSYKSEIINAGILSAKTAQIVYILDNKSLVLNNQNNGFILSVENKNEELIIKDNEGNQLNKKQIKKGKLIQEPENTSGAVLQDY